MHLNTGSLLQGGKYRIGSVLGQGGFGITYLAEQTGLKRKVAIKEFFMKEHCERDTDTSHVSVPSSGSRELVERFKTKFIKEAQTIAALSHPNIVQIHDIFEENGTAYYVMEYHGGGALSQMALPMAADKAAVFIRQISSALSYLHDRKIMHLDVKPSNVLIDENGNAVLIDFGISKRYDEAGRQTSSTPLGISHGYAPGEQYQQATLTFSPATDIYALGATFYKLVTDEIPPNFTVVSEDGLPPFPDTVPAGVVSVIEKSMQSKRKDRPQSVGEFLVLLDAALEEPVVDAGKVDVEETDVVVEDIGPSDPSDSPVPSKPSGFSESSDSPEPPFSGIRRLWWLWVLILGLVAGVVSYVVFSGGEDGAHSGIHNGHAWVDLGLPSGLKWATCNVGASSPEDYGYYYAWGEISPKSTYTADNCDSWGKSWGDIGGNSSRDAARANWGGKWRLPSEEEFQELLDHCTWTWTTQNGHNGYKVSSKTNDGSIFLPAAGWRFGEECYRVGSFGYYWGSTHNESSTDRAYRLFFGSGHSLVDWYSRFYGYSVRPALEE